MIYSLLKPLTQAVNACLRHDWESWGLLMTLQNKVVRLDVRDWPCPIAMQIQSHGLYLFVPVDEVKADLTVSATSMGLMEMVWRQQLGLPKGVRLHGDVHIAQVLQRILKNTNIDWPAVLSPFCGDTLAVSVVQAWDGVRDWVSTHARHRARDMRDVMQDEWRHLPHPAEVENFYHEIANLRDEVARCAAKLREKAARLERRAV